MIKEDDILSKIKNEKLKSFYEKFSKSTGLNVNFERLHNRVRAEHSYTDNSEIFIIRLRKDWREVDLSHELIHGKIMFIDQYGLIICDNALCKLIRAYIEDIIIHENIFNKFGIIPYDEEYVSLIKKLTGFKIKDSYWDQKGLICDQLHKALLYVQVWHFNQLTGRDEFIEFMINFRIIYGGKKEMELADEIIEIIKRNKYLDDKENYDNALEEIVQIEYLGLPKGKLIKHYLLERRPIGA